MSKNKFTVHKCFPEGRIVIGIEYDNGKYWAMTAYNEGVIKSWVNSSFVLSIQIQPKHVSITTDSIVMSSGNIKHSMYLTNGYGKVIAGYIITKPGYDNRITIANGDNMDDFNKLIERYIRKLNHGIDV